MKITLKTEDLKYIFDSCKNFVAKDDIRPILKNIHLRCNGERCTAYAADNHKLMSLSVPCEADEGKMNIPIIKLPKSNSVTICDDGNEIVFDFGDSRQIVEKPDGAFPDVERWREADEPALTIGFNPEKLRAALEGFKGDMTVIMTFTTPLNTCYISSTLTDKKALVMPVNLKK